MAVVHWSIREVQTLLAIVGEPRIREELCGAVRNQKVFKEVSQRFAAKGFRRSTQQCREKLKKLRSQYRMVKEKSNQDGAGRSSWRWFDAMDSIYGHRPENMGLPTDSVDSATSILLSIVKDENIPCEDGVKHEAPPSPDETAASPSVPVSAEPETPSAPKLRPVGKRKRVTDMTKVIREMQAADETAFERMEERYQRRHEVLLEDAREARRQEADLTRRYMEQTERFDQAFLGTLDQLVQVLGGHRKRETVPDMTTVIRERQATDETAFERMEEGCQRRHDAWLEEAREARRREAALTQRHLEQTDSFNQTVLGTLGQLVKELGGRRDSTPPPSQ